MNTIKCAGHKAPLVRRGQFGIHQRPDETTVRSVAKCLSINNGQKTLLEDEEKHGMSRALIDHENFIAKCIRCEQRAGLCCRSSRSRHTAGGQLFALRFAVWTIAKHTCSTDWSINTETCVLSHCDGWRLRFVCFVAHTPPEPTNCLTAWVRYRWKERASKRQGTGAIIRQRYWPLSTQIYL